jgi:UDP:flavonoid glycosyltransferase YjiC (YdhE family)
MERYIPQTLLFDHPDAVVSHAGSGTMLAALARGIPLLNLRQGADQFVHATNCTRAGVGLALSPDEVDGDAITDAVERVLQEPTFRDHASNIAVEIKSMPPPDDVAVVVVALAESMRRSGEARADGDRAGEIRVDRGPRSSMPIGEKPSPGG